MTSLLPQLERGMQRRRWRANARAVLLWVLTVIVLGMLWFAMSSLLAGCCTTGLITKCCPKPLPPVLVEVAKPCPLPPVPVLPAVDRTDKDCPATLVCFDIANAKAIAAREGFMKTWIREVRATCAPASQPAR